MVNFNGKFLKKTRKQDRNLKKKKQTKLDYWKRKKQMKKERNNWREIMTQLIDFIN